MTPSLRAVVGYTGCIFFPTGLASFNFLDHSRAEFLKKLSTWTFTSGDELERSERRIRDFVACKTEQEFVTTRLHNPGVEDVEISINTVTCGDHDENKPTLGMWTESDRSLQPNHEIDETDTT